MGTLTASQCLLPCCIYYSHGAGAVYAMLGTSCEGITCLFVPVGYFKGVRAQDVFGIAPSCWISGLLQLNQKLSVLMPFIRFNF